MDKNYKDMSCEKKIEALHNAGCKHKEPLLGWRPGVGPRCRLCNTVANTENV